jgi:hypothetical protein
MKNSKTDIAESNLYKGWVAVPTLKTFSSSEKRVSSSYSYRYDREDHSVPLRSLSGKLTPKFKKIGDMMKRVLRPIGSIFSCEICSKKKSAKSSHSSYDYPGIMIHSDAFDQKDC